MNTDRTIDHTTTCTIGGDVILPQTPHKYGYTFNGWGANYIPIEYLESTGTQYIDTGYIPNDKTTFRVKVMLTEFTDAIIVGYANSPEFYRVFCYSNKIYVDYGIGPSRIAGLTCVKNQLYDITIGPLYVKDNITDNIILGQKISTSFQGSFPLYICDPRADRQTKAKMYLVQIYQDNILVRDFIPVLDGNGTPCMYDKVENKFYYNAGTGQFIAGPVIGGD